MLKPRKYYSIHRLVAEAYLDNPDNLPCVNHKDENRSNNSVNNLEWCTLEYNTKYSSCKKIRCIETGEIFESMSDCAKAFDIGVSALSCYFKRNGKTCKGHTFEYI